MSFSVTMSNTETSPEAQNFFPKRKSHLKTLGARKVTWFHTEDPEVLGTTVQNLVLLAIWRPGFVHPWTSLLIELNKRTT